MEIKLHSTSNHLITLKQLTKDGKPSNVYMVNTTVPSEEIKKRHKDFKLQYIWFPGGPKIIVGKTIAKTNLLIEEIVYNKIKDKYLIRVQT